MKTYVYKNSDVPKEYIEDCMKLSRFIYEKLDALITLKDTYHFWLAVSDSWSAGWLDIDVTYEGTPREEFLQYQLDKFCYCMEG